MPALIAILVAKVTGQWYEPISMVWLRFFCADARAFKDLDIALTPGLGLPDMGLRA
jgi:hypothetical protein